MTMSAGRKQILLMGGGGNIPLNNMGIDIFVFKHPFLLDKYLIVSNVTL